MGDNETDPISAIPPGHYVQYFDELLYRNIGNEKLFHSSDSSYLFFQNDTSFRCTIGATLQPRLVTTTRIEQMKKKNLKRNEPFYEMTCPLLSKDKTKAFVELSFFCGDCGWGREYYLRKLNGKWKIEERVETWIN